MTNGEYATPITAVLAPEAKPIIQDTQEAVLLMLPTEESQTKLIELREACDNQRAMLMPIMDSVLEKREAHRRLEARIRQLRENFTVRETPDHPSLVSAERELAKVKGEIARLSARYESMGELCQARGRVVDRLSKGIS